MIIDAPRLLQGLVGLALIAGRPKRSSRESSRIWDVALIDRKALGSRFRSFLGRLYLVYHYRGPLDPSQKRGCIRRPL